MRMQLGGLWRHADFLRFWAGQSVSRVGTQITALALPTAAIHLFGAGPVEIGTLAALQSAPFPLLGILSGVLADRLPRRPILIACDVGRLVALGAIPAVFLMAQLTLWHLYIVALLVGVFTPFSAVASQAYLRALVDREHLLEANAKLELSNSTAGVAGRAAAGALIFWFQAPMAILVDAVSYLLSATLLLGVRTVEPAPVVRTDRATRSLWSDIRDGLAATFADPTIRLIAAASATVNLGVSVTQTVYLLYAYEVVGLDPAQVGLILTVGSVGSVLGAVVVYPVSRRVGVGPAMLLGVVVAFASFALLPLAQVGLAIPLMALASFLLYASLPVYFVNTITVRQAVVANELQGRVVGTIRTLVIAATPVGSLLGGMLGQQFGLLPTLLAGAALGLLAIGWILAGPITIDGDSTLVDRR